jgi:4-alpha-glucanotransferase
VSLGVPPDAFSATGQDWGLPTYRWDRIAATGFVWMRLRARRMAALFDGYRVDHLVGLYRTFGRRSPEDGFFNPDREAQQIAQGERILGILLESGASVVAEDLGVIPDFVRASLDRCQVPGCKVVRWERDWHAPGRPFTDPATYPACSAAMTGTHDTETLAEWWTRADRDEREATLAMLRPYVGAAHAFDAATPWSPALRDTLLSAVFASGSRELFVPVQDLFGWPDRINTPGTVGGHNWTWRLPWRVDELDRIPVARDRAAYCQALAARYERGTHRSRT